MSAERPSVRKMIQAEVDRKRVVEVIGDGVTGRKVTLDLDIASRVLRVSKERLQKMGERNQELGVSVKEGKVVVELQGSERSKRSAYKFFYGLLQAEKQGLGETFLEAQTVPQEITEMPGFKSTIEVIRKGTCDLPDEELLRLQVYLLSNWLALKDKSGLPKPEEVFTSLA